MSFLQRRNGVMTVSSPGVAAEEAFGSEETPFDDTMELKGFDGVV